MERLLAVYGTLRKGQSNHYILEDSEFLGITETDPIFTLYTNGFFPCLYHGVNKVIIEVYRITDPQIAFNIDQLEGFSGRRNNPLNWYDITDINTPWGLAEIFIYKTKPALPAIITGDWLSQKP